MMEKKGLRTVLYIGVAVHLLGKVPCLLGNNLHKECQEIDRNLQIKETKYVSVNAVIFFQNRNICYGMHLGTRKDYI
jgi:hypothetical protein